MAIIFPGTVAFLKSISLEAVALGVHLAAGAHDILLQAEYVLTSTPSPVSSTAKGKKKSNVRSDQPQDAQQGLRQVELEIPIYAFKCVALLLHVDMHMVQAFLLHP